MKRSLCELFLSLENNEKPPYSGAQGDLFNFDDSPAPPPLYEQKEIDLVSNFCSWDFDSSTLGVTAKKFYSLSVQGFDGFVRAWMSELPIEAQILGFGRTILAAKDKKRAKMAADDRGNADTRTVLAAAYKVQHEIHRMMGFLRFSLDKNGVFLARCAPDHLVLPALGGYLTARFGNAAWAVIDEKRGLRLSRKAGVKAKTSIYLEIDEKEDKNADEWEELWKHYHKTINNESRNNPNLQRQFMPKRYWKYLPEVENI